MNWQQYSRTPALLFALVLSPMLLAGTGAIVTIAGSGTFGSAGVGGPAVNAQLGPVFGIAVDAADDLFIADGYNNRIVRVDAVTGILTLVAGNGAASSSGDGGPATSATLSLPAGIALDSNGNLYIADSANFRVRRVDAQTGIITTVAGNGSNAVTADGVAAAGASLAHPMWVAFDGSGGLLISEWGGNRIRRVDPLTGILTTIVGNGDPNFTGDGVAAASAGIGGPIALLVDPAGNLFFVDGTGRVRRVDASTGVISTVAGNGSGPHGITSASAGGGGGGGVAGPVCSTVAGDNGPATGATLDGPFGVQLTRNGNLLVSDTLDCRVRRVYLPSPNPYTNTALTASATTLQGGQSVLLTATVSPIGASGVPTGGIQFVNAPQFSSPTVLGTAALNGGTASLVVSTLSQFGGQVLAYYSGDAAFNSSGSPGIPISVSGAPKALATVTLSASQTSSSVGATTIFTATVTPPAGDTTALSGPVLLVDGSALVATANLVNGIATLPAVFSTPGNHAMTAIYLGDNNHSQVSSATLAQPVNGATSQVSIVSSAPNSTYGQPIQLTISVLPSSATGTIQMIMDQSPIPGLGLLINGTVIARPPTLAAGAHTITAVYSGDANNPPATSTPFTQNIAKATPLFTVTSSLNPSAAGQAVTLTVTMTPVSSGAGLDLQIGNPPASLNATWSAGKTSITTADLAIGTHTVTGAWGGDANVLAGSSAVVIQTVQANTTTTSLTASPNPSVYGGSVTLTATVLPASATGLVAFNSNGVPVGAANLVSGQAQVSLATLPVGSNSLTAVYGGDATNGSSNSAVVAQTVAAAGIPSSVTLTSSANPSVAGRPLWFTATVSPATATGTVQFLDGATSLGTATIARGWTTLPLSTLPVGAHSITALYSGDVNDSASTSAALAEAIGPASPSAVGPDIITTLVGLPNGCAPGVPYCGIGNPGADAAGNIYFQDGYQILTRNSSGVTSVIAGNGQVGISGDGGPALSASLGAAGQLAVHGSRVCFGEPSAHKIRCVDLGTGLIQGYGTGIQNSGGDGGNVSNAGFDFPVGAAFDDAGNLYISDFGRNNVRRIDAVTSIVTLFAGPGPGYAGAPLGDGGPSVGANLLQPGSLSYYNGGIYIADPGNGRIRRADLATGMISSVAAAGSSYIAMDQSGNLFYTSGLTVQMMDPSGNVSAIADTNSYSGSGADDILAADTVFGGMAGLGWDPLAQRLLIADQSRLRQIFFTPPTTTALTLSPNPVAPGGQVTLQATVSPATATGSVRFYRDNVLLGSAPLVNSAAGFTWTAPIGGNSTARMRAVYGGDANSNLSMSATLTETAQQGTTATTGSLTASPNPSVLGGSVTLSVTVSPATATGAVAFYGNSAIVGTATVVSGQAQLSLATLPLGSNLLMARYGGDLTYAGSSSNAVAQIVAGASAGVALTSSANPSIAGQALTLTAAISPATATGTVQFLDGATALGTAAIGGGSAALSLSTLPVGTHSITAVYSGDANDVGGTSAILAQAVNTVASNVALVSSANPSTSGQNITLTAAVTPGTATGTVQFLDGSTVLGTVAVTGGSAALSLSTLSADTHPLTAVYSGNANNATSTSAVQYQIVNKLASSVALTYSANPSPLGQPLTLTATLLPNPATGTIQFLDGSTVLSTVAVSGGSAAFSTSSLTAGGHSIGASYSGDASYLATITGAVIVVKPVTTMTLSVLPNPPIAGQVVTFTAVLSPGAATGSVSFSDWSGAQLGSAVLSGGRATLLVSPQTFAFAAGAQKIMVSYDGDATHMNSIGVLTMTVNQAPASVALASSKNPSTSGQSVTFTATVSPASAGGSVQFLDGSSVLGTAAVSGGLATLSLSTLSAGAHSISAVYSGDANDAAGTSAIQSQTVNKAASSVALICSQNPALFGQSIPLSATVTPGSATGTVQFMDGSTVLGTVAVSGGSAAMSLFTLRVGPHAITAVYSGDAYDTGGTSPVVTETINLDASTVTVASLLNPSLFGQSVTFSATVTPRAASGTVQFLDGSTVLGTVTISGGSAALSLSTLRPGAHLITAVYSGDGNDTANTSFFLTQTVSAPLPNPPANLTATAASSGQINLTWTASPTLGVSYDIYSAAASGFVPSASNRIASGVIATSYSNPGLPPSTTRYYLVTALNSAGESAPSNQATATTAAAGACHVAYTVTTQWNVGFGTAITIQNTGTKPINGWNLTWTWAGNQAITQAWNSNNSQIGPNARLTNASWNPAIAAGATIGGIGFNASYSGANTAPAAFYLNGTLCK